MEGCSANNKGGGDKAVPPIEHAKRAVRSEATLVVLNQVLSRIPNNLKNNEYRKHCTGHGYKGGCAPFKKIIGGNFEEHEDQKPNCNS